MPHAYEAMRDHFIRQGMKEKAAKSKAARIYNAKHPRNPVTGNRRDNRETRDNRDFAGKD